MSLWGGRFQEGLHPAFDSFNRSLPFDRRLWAADIEGSRAWARAHVAAGSLNAREGQRLLASLARLAKELGKDESALVASEAEDIHSFVEARLVEDLGPLGKKLHAGRSRNDQVATDLRLYCRQRIDELDTALLALMSALADLAEGEAATPLPGYTHLQRAQILTVGHHLLAYVEMLARDRSRLADAGRRMDECPLGCGALAGTGFAIDRQELARDLGFRKPARNSVDAVSDRDFVAELMFVSTLSAAHLSRLSEDWIFYASQEAGFLQLSDAVTTGSSLMPQKKNPDSLELIRGKGARILGRLTGFLGCLRSLPLAYNKDLQEDKEALFESLDTWEACLTVARLCVEGARFDAEALRLACVQGYLNATELADHLVEKGVPFREAHDQVGQLVRLGLERGEELSELPLDLVRGISPVLDDGFRKALRIDAVLARRRSLGGANPRLVLREARRWKKTIAKELA